MVSAVLLLILFLFSRHIYIYICLFINELMSMVQYSILTIFNTSMITYLVKINGINFTTFELKIQIKN